MKLSSDEARALGFVALLLALATAVRWLEQPPEPLPDGAGLDLARLEAASTREAAAEARRSRPLEPGETIDPNSAPADELERLPGVGPALAARIIADRAQNGAYRVLSDLDRVTGIGERTLEVLAPHLDLPKGPSRAASSLMAADSGRSAATGSALSAAAGAALSPAGGATALRVDETGTAPPPSPEEPLDLNAAGASELERLPGVGPVLAARIVAFRDSVGRFRTLEDVDHVPGIGPKTLARLAPLVRLKP